MSIDDVPGYMMDEVAKTIKDLGVTTEDELYEDRCNEGGQIYEELGYDLMIMYLRAKNDGEVQSDKEQEAQPTEGEESNPQEG